MTEPEQQPDVDRAGAEAPRPTGARRYTPDEAHTAATQPQEAAPRGAHQYEPPREMPRPETPRPGTARYEPPRTTGQSETRPEARQAETPQREARQHEQPQREARQHEQPQREVQQHEQPQREVQQHEQPQREVQQHEGQEHESRLQGNQQQGTQQHAPPSGTQARQQAGTQQLAGTQRRDDRPAGGTGGGGDLVPAERAESYRARWEAVKGRFVDEPEQAVAQAEALVGELFEELLSAQRRSGQESDANSTEDLRLALLRYRTFLDRLLTL